MPEDLLSAESHFAFGKNWKSFLTVLDRERIEEAEKGLLKLFPEGELGGRTFCDIGCGSGLHSLAAAKLGAASLTGFDIDPHSVEAMRGLLTQAQPGVPWSASVRSVFDLDPEKDGQFEVVYSWGVLHHTGDMWRAVEMAASMVKPGGLFALALYRKTPTCGFYTKEKRLYSRSGPLVQATLRAVYKTTWFLYKMATRQRPLKIIREYKSSRGMSWTHDVHDWLGGYPYESASPEEVRSHLKSLGFIVTREFVTPAGSSLWGSGCDEFVARKT